MRLTKRFEFDSAHFLPNYEGACKNVHGHRFSCELTVSGEYDDKTGMICDFNKLKKLINVNVVDVLDHKLLNDIIENPTAENIVVWIFDALYEDLDRVGLAIAKIQLWENKNNSVVFDPLEEIEFEFDDEDNNNPDDNN